MADECQDISSQEELSICCRWLVNGCPQECFMSILHVKSVDAATITDALLTFLRDNDLDFSKLVGQGYDGASVFSGHVNGVQKRLRLHSCHAIYIHCACHRLQLASLQAADAITSVKKIFGAMSNLWKLFHYSPKKN